MQLCWRKSCNAKTDSFWGGAPDPDGGAYSAPPYPLAGLVWVTTVQPDHSLYRGAGPAYISYERTNKTVGLMQAFSQTNWGGGGGGGGGGGIPLAFRKARALSP